ncbi:hypothetical protein ACHAQH_008559 [Verticillium albo-atrum]
MNSVANFLKTLVAVVGGSDARILVVSRFLSTIQNALKGDDHTAFSEYQIRPDDVRSDTEAYCRDIVDSKLGNKHEDARSSLS